MNNLYLVAANVFDEKKSRILETLPPVFKMPDSNFLSSSLLDAVNTLKLRIDLTEFIGGGYEINLCRRINTLDDGDETPVIPNSNGKSQIFDVLEMIEEFPLIEGRLVPGIYQIGNGGTTYCGVGV